MKATNVRLFLLWIATAIFHALMEFLLFAETPEASIIFAIVSAYIIFYWYYCDSTHREYQRSRWLNIGIASFSILAVPYYFVRTRSLLTGVASLLILIFLYLVYMIVFTVTYVLMQFVFNQSNF